MTTKAQHTPGPWVMGLVDDGFGHDVYWRIGKDKRHPAATIKIFKSHATSREEAEANARLIAAAPDLLAACEAALPAILWGATHQPGNMSQWHEVEDLLRAAIAKTKPQGG